MEDRAGSPRIASLDIADLNGDCSADLVGLAANKTIWYTLNQKQWVGLPGQLSKLSAYDVSSDGRADLVGLASNGSVWYMLDLRHWVNVAAPTGQTLTQLKAGSYPLSMVGLTATGSIFYSENLRTWKQPSITKGMSSLRLLDVNGDGVLDIVGIEKATGLVAFSVDEGKSWKVLTGQVLQQLSD